MKLLTKTIPRTCNIYLAGDEHVGADLRHKHGCSELVKLIEADPLGYLVHHGDSIEAITINDKRYDRRSLDSTASTPMLQCRSVIEQYKPIKDKILAWLIGNHEFSLLSRMEEDYTREVICHELTDGNPDSIYGTYMAHITYVDEDGNELFKHLAWHGAGQVNSVRENPTDRYIATQKSLKRKLYRKAGDCSLMSMGHTHKIIVTPPSVTMPDLYIVASGKKLVQRYTSVEQGVGFVHPDSRWYVNTGSFLKLYGDGVSGYAERAGYDPLELGFAIVRVIEGRIAAIDRIILK